LPLADLTSGIYVVRIQTEMGTITEKLNVTK
jgi:hypothetical protein